MDSLPPEILHLIFSKLRKRDAANVRLLCTKFAEVAAHYIVSGIRFHTSLESLQRLNFFAKHAIFSQTIKAVIYERSLIADIGCVHAYLNHFEDERHHAGERPRPLPSTATDRERRLYQRNKTKAEQQTMINYKNYRQLYEAQQVLFNSGSQLLDTLIGESMSQFTNLAKLEFSPPRRCSHQSSSRFNEKFGASCMVPMTMDSMHSALQVRNMIAPEGLISSTLRELELYNLSPSFFSGMIPKGQMEKAFSRLGHLTLLIKIASDDLNDNENAPEDALHRLLSTGILKDALASARNLQALDVGLVPDVCEIKSSDIFTDTVSWPLLGYLALKSVTTTRDDLTSFLKRQPALTDVSVACMDLSTGDWVDTISDLRKDVDLDSFVATGYLQDSARLYPMSLLDLSRYSDNMEQIRLSDAIDMFVSDREYTTDDDHPLLEQFENFADEEFVFDTYGPPPSDLYDIDDVMLDFLGEVDDDGLSGAGRDPDSDMSDDDDDAAFLSELKGLATPSEDDMDVILSA